MCGIVGKFSIKGQSNISVDLIKEMTGAIRHRGPDESGIYIDNWIGLGHARLSIIDLQKGSQPIHNEDSTLWIVYNGEVFNYPELRHDLLQKGHSFYTSTDTEVILHLYEEKGAACLEELNGQFAFAIWNSREKELFLARDRTGIRPLYYTVQNNSLVFASEIKSIFMDEKIPRQINPESLNQIFTFWTTLQSETVFKDIQELPPGHHLKASQGNITVSKYWDIPFYPTEEHLNWKEDEICERVQELIKDAVRIRLRADVPVGCYLSGGLDSSGIAALVVKNFNSDVRTFGIRFDEENFDEGVHQNHMVSFLAARHTEIRASNENIAAALPDVLWHAEKPLLRTGPVPLFLLSGLVNRSGLKVVLTGEGADEIFGGYNIFREAKVRNFWAKQPESKIRGLLIGRLYPYIFNDPRLGSMMQSFFGDGLDKNEDPFFSHHLRWQTTSKIKVFLSEEMKNAVNPQNDIENLKSTLPDSFSQWDYLSKAQYIEMRIFLSNYLLSSQGDRVAMAHSVEIRLPFLDHRVIDFMGRVPAKLKIKGLNEKYILKKSFKEILPEKIINRQKQPYRAPAGKSLLDNGTASYNLEMLSESSLKNAGLFDVGKVGKFMKKIDRIKNPGETDSMALVGILSSQIIYDKFIARFSGNNIMPVLPDNVIDMRKQG